MSFFVPAVGIIFALGAAAGVAGGIPFWPLWSGVVIGASLGNLISWWIGVHYGHVFKEWKPIRDRPQILAASENAIKRWGVAAIFIGRFFGPLHGTVATLAAMGGLNPAQFHIANWLSAMACWPAPSSTAAWPAGTWRADCSSGAEPSLAPSRVDRLAAREHRDEVGDATHPRLRPLRSVDAV